MNSGDSSGGNSDDSSTGNQSSLAVVLMLFGLLALASYGNELLRQAVIIPGSSADLGIAADCRADELEEEQLTLEECQLMVSSVKIFLSSSPAWFRSFQIALASLGASAALLSIASAIALINRRPPALRLALFATALLLVLDVAGFIAAVNTGPLLRAQYLWPLLLWVAIHLCLLMALLRVTQTDEAASR